MKLLNGRDCFTSESYGHLLLVVIVISISFFLCMAAPISSSAQISSPLSSALNETSTVPPESSERLTPPLFPSQTQGQGTPLGLQEQGYSMYKSSQHGFSIQYPSDWQVRESEAGGGVMTSFTSPIESNFDPFHANFVIGVENLTSGTSLDNYTNSIVELLQSQPPGQDFKLTEGPISTTVGGLPAKRIGFTVTLSNETSSNSESNLQGVHFWTVQGDHGYAISFAAEQDKFSSYRPVMNHIIDTFRISGTTGYQFSS